MSRPKPPAPARDASPTLHIRGELGRKALHLLSLALPVGMLVLPYGVAAVCLGTLAVTALATEIARDRSAAAHAAVDRHFGWMMRPQERVRGSGFCGATWVVVTAALLLLAFDPVPAAMGMAMALTGDAAAALVGRTVGRLQWPGSRRTVEGSLAFIVFALLVSIPFPGPALPVRLAAAAGSALAEVLPVPINDNLLLPFAAAGLLTLLS